MISCHAPIDTLTYLFTDIEGSTALLARLGDDDYARALAEHHDVVRTQLAAHGGAEHGTQGDSLRTAEVLATELGDAEFARHLEVGRRFSFDQAMDLALGRSGPLA